MQFLPKVRCRHEDGRMLTDILEQRERLRNKNWWNGNFEVHMNLDDYHKLLAENIKTGVDFCLKCNVGCNRIYGMEIVIDDSEKPCVKLTE